MVSTSSLILAVPQGSVAQAISYITPHKPARLDFLTDYLNTLWTVSVEAKIDFVLLVAQAIHETDFFTSYWWVNRGNPAGMGVTGDTAQNEASPTFATGTLAARAQASHHVLYNTGAIARGDLKPADDPRYADYIAAFGHTVQATVLKDYGSGVWAGEPKPGYADMIVPYALGILAIPAPHPGCWGNGSGRV
jgi:hypothetical protein